jgi:hypothetical protein
MYDDAPSPEPFKCDLGNGPCCVGNNGEYVGPGCRHCCPPDSESIHTGFEIWDRPDFFRLRDELACTAKLGYCLSVRTQDGFSGWFGKLIGHNFRLSSAARRKVETICDDSDTHDEAKFRYLSWSAATKEKIKVIEDKESV